MNQDDAEGGTVTRTVEGRRGGVRRSSEGQGPACGSQAYDPPTGRTIGPELSDGTCTVSGPSHCRPVDPLGPYVMRSRIYQSIMDEETLDQDTVDEIYRYLASVNLAISGA